MELHMKRDGRPSHELTKKDSWNASLFALRGWFVLASQAEAVGVDLYQIKPPGKRLNPKCYSLQL